MLGMQIRFFSAFHGSFYWLLHDKSKSLFEIYVFV